MAEYIERDSLLDEILKLPPKMDDLGYGWLPRAAVYKEILDYPAADVAPVRHGRWVIKRDAMGTEYTICNACGLGFYNENSAGFERLDLRNCGYCPGCGAKMDVPDTDVGERDGDGE